MKFISSCKQAIALLGLLGALCGANLASASSYSIEVNTSAIVGNPAGPFSLGFQSIYGSGSGQTITLSNFVLTGGDFVAGTDFAIGAVSGSVTSALVLAPGLGSVYNEFFQQFEAAVTRIQFDLDISAGTAAGIPTSFAVWMLDGAELYPIPTTGFADTLVMFDIDGANTSYATGISTGDTAGVRASVPDTGVTAGFLLGGVVLLGAMRRRLATAA